MLLPQLPGGLDPLAMLVYYFELERERKEERRKNEGSTSRLSDQVVSKKLALLAELRVAREELEVINCYRLGLIGF